MALYIPSDNEYPGATRTLTVTSMTLGGVFVTDAMAGVSVTYALTAEDGTSIDTGALAYVAGTDATWEADITTPDRPAENVTVEIRATRGSSVGIWRGHLRVQA